VNKIKAFTQEYPYFLLLVIITFSVTLRVYYIYQKKAFHIDEILSFQIINGNSNSRYKEFDHKYKNRWINGEVFTSYFFTINKKNLKKDLKALLRDTKDGSHPNLYYIALRLVLFNGIRGVDGLFKFYAIGLNIFLYSIGAFFLYLLFFNIYKKETYALLAVFFYSISIGSISTSIYIRMYELLSLSVILTFFVVFKILDKKEPALSDFILLSLVSTLGYLSHYYYTIFVLILIFLILYHYLKNKQLKFIPYYLIGFIQGLINAQAFYPQFIKGLLESDRAKEAYSKIDIAFLISQLILKFKATSVIINKNVIYFLPIIALSILILVGHSLLKKDKTIINLKEIYLILISLSLSFLLIYISPYNIIRYLSGAIPILIVLIIFSIRLIPLKNLKYLIVVVLCIIYIIKSLNVSSVDYVYKGDQDKLIFKEMPSAPVYFLHSSIWWHGIVSAYLIGTQKYKVVLDKEPVLDFSETGSKKIYLIIDGDTKFSVIKKQIEYEKWIIKEKVNYRSLIIIGIEKTNAVI
jgi:hypothetical protein